MVKKQKTQKIYLDYAATTPVDPVVFQKMQPYFSDKFGNASSFHPLGEEAKVAIEQARKKVADFLSCSLDEVFFTGSATEADNWVFFGLADLWNNSPKAHIITSAIEHKAVLESASVLLKRGLIELAVLPVDKGGLVRLTDLEKAIKDNTRLISIMYANNEIGTIQPIKQIGQLLKKINQKRIRPIVFHSDAVQAVNYLDCRVDYLSVDAMSISGHKIYGPKGVGVLYLRRGTRLKPLIYGGGHENGMRSGTENVAGIVGLGEAIEKIKSLPRAKSRGQKPAPSEVEGSKACPERSRGVKYILKLRDQLIKGILGSIPRTRLNGSLEQRLPNNVNISFDGAEGESVIMDLAQKGIFASTASACASRSLKPSHVLLALRFSAERAHSSVRFTLGRQTTEPEIDYVLKVLPGIVERLRKISGR